MNKCALLNACTIAGNDILVPVEGFLLATFEASLTSIITIHIDKSHSACSFHQFQLKPDRYNPKSYNQTSQRHLGIWHLAWPWCGPLSKQSDNHLLHGHFSSSVSIAPETIFHDEHGLLVTIPDSIEGDTKTQWVNLPSPFWGFQIRDFW